MIASPKISLRLVYFIAVGATAAFVHVVTVFNLVNYMAMQPLTANLIAFLIAFNISYIGHKSLTFAGLHQEKQLSLPHFFMVASSAGILNEFLYFLLLNYTAVNYVIALIGVLGFVAVYTFFLSRYWACR